jgi:hypothetical protein
MELFFSHYKCEFNSSALQMRTSGGYISVKEKVKYIHQNPVKAMIVYSAEQYVFSSAIDYADGIGLVKITKY